jgi:5-methylcytosine-specific restriction endonuclease McrA
MKAMRPKAPLVPTECAYCGKALKRIRGQILRAKRQFCNNTCHGQWLYEYGPKAEAHPCWTGGEVEYRGPNWNAQSEAARARDNYCCQYCGLSQENHRRALDVHHIIPFRDFKYIPGENNRYLEANDLSNLITLCPVCHKKAEFGKIEI